MSNPGPYSCALAALNRARSRHQACVRALTPSYNHNESKLLRRELPLTNNAWHALARQRDWHKEWIKVGEAVLHDYQANPPAPWGHSDRTRSRPEKLVQVEARRDDGRAL